MSPITSNGPWKQRPKSHDSTPSSSSSFSSLLSASPESSLQSSRAAREAMAGLVQLMKDLYFAPPPGKVCRISPRNGLTAVPKIPLFCITSSNLLSFFLSPKYFFASSRAGVWWGCLLVMRQGVIQDLEHAMRTKVNSPARIPLPWHPRKPRKWKSKSSLIFWVGCCGWCCRVDWPKKRTPGFRLPFWFHMWTSVCSEDWAAM